MAESISIYGYTNYRSYLAAFYTHRKDGKRGYSYRQFSLAAGFSSPNFLKLVIDGQRNLTVQSIESCLLALQLSAQQAAYFRTLVALNQATTDEERHVYFAKLKKLIPHTRRYELDADALEYLSHWIFPVLRELVADPDFRDDPYWIQRRLTGRIELKDIVSALSFLKKKGMIKKEADGSYTLKDDMVISSDEVKSLAIRTYHRKALEQSIAALEDLPLELREFGALIFKIPSASLPDLKQRLKTFRKELHTWALEEANDEKKETTVVQLNLQMYPQTKRSGS